MVSLSPEAQRIDDEFVETSRRWGQFYNLTANRHGYRLLVDGIRVLTERVGSYKPESRFEELWRENMLHGLEVQAMLAYHFHGKPRLSVPELLDVACGPGAYGLVEKSFSEYDDKAEWDEREGLLKFGKTRVSTSTNEARKAIQDYIPTFRDELYKYGTLGGFIPEGFDIAVDVGEGRAGWNTDLKRFLIGWEEFYCDMATGEIKVVPIQAYDVAFHELFGHGSQQLNSERLPQSLQMTTENVLNLPSRIVYEGLAMQGNFLAYAWMQKNAERLGINPSEIDIRRKSRTSSIKYPNPDVILGILEERRKWEGLDIENYLSALVANPRVVWRFSDPVRSGFSRMAGEPLPITRALFELCYPAGYKMVQDTVSRFSGADQRQLNTAMSTGTWGWKVYPEAVAYFMEE